MIASNVADEIARTSRVLFVCPDKNDKMIVIKERLRRTDTNVHHQCSDLAKRNRSVHMLASSATDARIVTKP
jgi:hypothetical protein